MVSSAEIFNKFTIETITGGKQIRITEPHTGDIDILFLLLLAGLMKEHCSRLYQVRQGIIRPDLNKHRQLMVMIYMALLVPAIM